MGRITDITKIVNPDADTPEAAPGLGGDDFLSRVNLAIKNFKNLIEVAKQFRGTEDGLVTKQPKSSKEVAAPAAPGLADYIRLAIQAGHGDTPIGKLIEDISPHTLKQIVEILRNAKPGK